MVRTPPSLLESVKRVGFLGPCLAAVLASADGKGSPTIAVPLTCLVTTGFWIRQARKSGTDAAFWRLGLAGTVAALCGFVALGLGFDATSPMVLVPFVSSYGLMAASQRAIIRSRALPMTFGTVLDGVLVALVGSAGLIWLSQSVEAQNRGLSPIFEVYAILDLFLLGSSINLGSAFRWRIPRQIQLVIWAQIALLVGDLLPMFAPPSVIALGFTPRLMVVGYLLIAAALLAPNRWSAAVEVQQNSRRVFVVAWAATPPALVLLLTPTGALPKLLAAATVLGVVIRLSSAYGLAKHQAALRQEARTDDLTGLPNRRAVRERLTELTGNSEPFAVAVMDLDDFKNVNDSLGHEAGDLLLRTVSLRLLRAANKFGGDVQMFRLGGDEFAAVVTDVEVLEQLAMEIRRLVSIPVSVESERIEQEVSIGFATYPTDALRPTELLRLADAAMYRAKRFGSGVERHAEDVSVDLNPLRMMTLLREALHNDTFELHYQPQIRLADGSVFGVEALFRLEHEGSYLQTEALIVSARSAGLLRELTDRVVERALSDLVKLSKHHPNLSLSLNVSAHDMSSGSLPERLLPAIRRHRIAASRVCIEVTEEALLGDPEVAARTVQVVRAAGVTVSMDDFGVGFSSFSNLRSLDVDEIKIDRSFVHGMVGNKRTEALILTIVDLARRLEARVIVEGIEEVDELTMARSLGIDIAQGWVFSKALPIAELQEWLKGSGNKISDHQIPGNKIPGHQISGNKIPGHQISGHQINKQLDVPQRAATN